MPNPNSFMIESDLLPALGYASKLPLTTISPLNYPDSPEMEQFFPFLKEGGFLSPGNTLSPSIKDSVEKLARARTFTRVYLSSRFGVFEFITYFTPEGSWVSLSTMGNSTRIDEPGQINEIVETVRQQIGDSIFSSGSFHASLKPAEALVLAALWDLRRKALLTALAEEKMADPSGYLIGTILEQSSKNDEKYQWMTNVVRNWTGFGGTLTTDEVKSAAETLAARNYCAKQAESYSLAGDALDCAEDMLIFSNVVTLTSGIEGPDGKVAVVGFSCMQAGVHDLLMIDFQDGNLELDSVSAGEVVDTIDAFMRKPLELLTPFIPAPEVVKEPGPTPPKKVPGAAPAVATCPKCGAPIKGGQQFCGSCGAKTAEKPAPATCPKCGSPVIPGKKFCGTCGTPLTVPSVTTRTGMPVCPKCGSPVTPGKKFCGSCGAKIEG